MSLTYQKYNCSSEKKGYYISRTQVHVVRFDRRALLSKSHLETTLFRGTIVNRTTYC